MALGSRRVPSAALDDGASIRSRAYYNSSHPLQPADSRYSLRDQFAATRREYEFGFDDASSVLERSTLASEAVRGDEFDDTVVDGAQPSALSDGSTASRDCYELLCLPRGADLSPDQVRGAAQRLTQVLAVDKQPPRLQSSAAFYLGLAQAAFETLVDPSRRLGYDLSGASENDSDSDEATIDDALPGPGNSGGYDSRLQEQYLLLTQRESRAVTELGLRVDATSLLAPQRGSRRQASGLEVLDLSLRKSATASAPALRKPIEKAIMFAQGMVNRNTQAAEAAHPVRLADPTVTITGSTHGLLDEPFRLAPLLVDRYQPAGPSIHGRRRMEQLLASRFLPLLSLNLRQELFWQTEPPPRALPDLVIEQELELLPHPSTTTRIGYSIDLSGGDGPLNVEVSARKLLTRRSDLSPSLGLAVHQRIGPGTAFLVADGGDWNLRTSKECRELSQFSKVSGSLAPMVDAFRNPPTVEIGYAFGRHDLGMQSGQAFTKPSERGLSGLDSDLDEHKPSSWTVSTGFAPGIAATYLRYGRDLFTSSIPTKPKPSSRHQKKTGLRAEAELAGTTQRDFFLAFRALKRIGRFSKAGLEIGLSPSNLHLSLYWSRLGQRISLPFLVTSTTTTRTRFTTRLLFWTTVFPFAALAAWELYRQKSQSQSQSQSQRRAFSTTKAALYKEKQLQAYIARRRAEADELTVVLATGVEPRQAGQRTRGGLMVVSAKYGVRDAPPDESRLLGFWDPAPGRTKVLRVRYLWRGEEREVEVWGRGELRLP
ncbi:hypothetical protein C8A01DRAFT_42662 [Parachaetomium inaequale]|uniref:J domain-containing protein n=1 Tax=Parachaetomium inaequale TaxID=2588326 RepID=A0AAN6PNV5_9PEZI|nr:hypothetical protein C8A01DRAFT_42662 [Parachaetomium inaequale]